MNNKTLKNFKILLKVSGLFNMTVAFLFIFPFTYEYYIEFFNIVNESFYLGGSLITIPTDTFHSLFINTAGIDLVLIGSFVLLASIDPLSKISKSIIIFNGAGRFLFSIIIVYYTITKGMIGIFVVIGMIDIIITSGFIFYLNKLSKQYNINCGVK